MAGASARDDGDLGFCGVGTEVDDFVLGVEGGGGVGEGDGFEGGEDEVGWVVYEVFGWEVRQCMSELMFGLVVFGWTYKTWL